MTPAESMRNGRQWSLMITSGGLRNSNYNKLAKRQLSEIRNAAGSGVSAVQIREKQLSTRNLVDLAKRTVEICRQHGTEILINERFDVALVSGADGVHLTSSSVPVERVRSVMPADHLIGVSTHSIDEAKAAWAGGADYVLFGPVFDSPEKRKYGKPQGVNELKRVCRELRGFPVIAVGGISESNIDEIRRNGAAGFAAIRMFEAQARTGERTLA